MLRRSDTAPGQAQMSGTRRCSAAGAKLRQAFVLDRIGLSPSIFRIAQACRFTSTALVRFRLFDGGRGYGLELPYFFPKFSVPTSRLFAWRLCLVVPGLYVVWKTLRGKPIVRLGRKALSPCNRVDGRVAWEAVQCVLSERGGKKLRWRTRHETTQEKTFHCSPSRGGHCNHGRQLTGPRRVCVYDHRRRLPV